MDQDATWCAAIGLGPGHIVLDGDPPTPPPHQKRGHSSPPPAPNSAHVCCGQTAGRINMPLGTEAGLGPGDTVLEGDPAPPKKGHSTPTFRPMSIVAKRSPLSATAEILFCFAAKSVRNRLFNRATSIHHPLNTIQQEVRFR